MIRWTRAALAAAALLAAAPAQAEIAASGPTGFVSRHVIEAPVAPGELLKRFAEVGRWWDGAHSFSGDAANLSLKLRPGGCWCERLAGGGFVEHLRVAQFAPGERIVMTGGLGPIGMMAAAGNFQVDVGPRDGGGARMTWTYAVAGYPPAGMETLAKPVDGVLAAAAARLTAYAGGTSPS
jgi:hypothetical protein